MRGVLHVTSYTADNSYTTDNKQRRGAIGRGVERSIESDNLTKPVIYPHARRVNTQLWP